MIELTVKMDEFEREEESIRKLIERDRADMELDVWLAEAQNLGWRVGLRDLAEMIPLGEVDKV